MSLFNIVIENNRVQTDLYQSQSKSSNANSHRGREDARDRDKMKDNSRDKRDKRDESQSNQNDDNHSLQNIECYQCKKKRHISRNCPEKKKDDSNFNIENSEFRQNSN